MRKVKSAAALKADALKRGATVTAGDGTKFNTGKKQVEKVVARKPLPEVKVEVEIENEGPDEGSMLVAAKLTEVGKLNAAALEGLKNQISQIQLSYPAPPTEW